MSVLPDGRLESKLVDLKPLYTALAKSGDGKQFARGAFDRLRPTYHPIAQQVIEGLLE